MKKKIILGAAILSVTFFFGCKKDEATSLENVPSVVEETKIERYDPEKELQVQSLEQMLRARRSMKCRMKKNEDGGDAGLVYISKGRVRIEKEERFKASEEAEEEVSTSFSLIKDGNLHLWSSRDKNGMKTSFSSAINPQPVEGQSEMNQLVSSGSTAVLGEDLKYECEGWKIEEDKFELPQEITFKENQVKTETPEQRSEEGVVEEQEEQESGEQEAPADAGIENKE